MEQVAQLDAQRRLPHLGVRADHGELAQAMATIAAASMTIPPAASWRRIRCSGCTTVRGT